MVFVPEGQHDSSQARSAWESVPRKNRPIGYGMSGRSYSQSYYFSSKCFVTPIIETVIFSKMLLAVAPNEMVAAGYCAQRCKLRSPQ